ncbi:MAG: LysM peptidoglycan-binding domain-containing protein [Pseudomonadota bacterium]|nr:LysM peptidoglycan-binding domain-containing protein [Pseudomonadota bacterium]
MKIVNSLKLAGLLITAVSVSVGCAGTTEEEAQEPAPTEVTTPEPETQTTDQSGMLGPDTGSMSEYTVVRGDNLWDISAKSEIYGNPYQWPLIYKTNSNQIEDADLILPGQILDIDDAPSSSEVDAAVRHARTRGSWSVGVVEDSDRDYLAR